MVDLLEALVFKVRLIILASLGVFTLCAGFYAVQWKMDASFGKQLPFGHEYSQTFQDYREKLFGSNQIVLALEQRAQSPIWTKEFFTRYKEMTYDVLNLPGVDRHTVTSLWTSNARYLKTTEEGMSAESVIDDQITSGALNEVALARIETNVKRGGFTGRLVAADSTAAMITAELRDDRPKTQETLDYFDLAEKLETEIRRKYENETYIVRITGFAKLTGDIAGGAREMIFFFLAAFLVTALSVYLYSRSLALTLLPLFCSLTAMVWLGGVLSFFGYGLDPVTTGLALFVIFAIGVSHGVQQINLIGADLGAGSSGEEAARASFRELLIPGVVALLTNIVGFGTLYMIPIPIIGDLAVTIAIGVAFTIVTNLIMLPVLASYLRFTQSFAQRIARVHEARLKAMRIIGKIANPGAAMATLAIAAGLFMIAIVESQSLYVGALHPGSPELYADARYNVDAKAIADKFALGLNLLTIVNETPTEACIKYPFMEYLNQLSWHMQNVEGVSLVLSLPYAVKSSSAGWNEGNLKWKDIPRNQFALVQAVGPIPPSSGLLNQNCSVLPVQIFLEDAKASTIKKAVEAVKEFRAQTPMEGVDIRLASGNMGVQAAINDEVERSELPMMLWIYVAFASLIILTYRDWRAVITCCMPLTIATFCGYWVMKEWEIGLTVATLPVMALAAGLGVDYVFYVYHRIQTHLAVGLNITDAYKKALRETGMAVIVTAIALAVGVSSWTFSTFKFQADMGLLWTFMLIANMIMAILVLPALAVMLDRLAPRKKPVKAPPGTSIGASAR